MSHNAELSGSPAPTGDGGGSGGAVTSIVLEAVSYTVLLSCSVL